MSNGSDLEMQSRADIRQDCEELLWLANDRVHRLSTLRSRHRKYLIPETSEMLLKQVTEMIRVYRDVSVELLSTMKQSKVGDIEEMISVHRRIADQLRSLQGVSAALCVAPDWQSPSFLHSQQSQAGMETGKITGTINDYKRDQHGIGLKYEQKYCFEYIDASLRLAPQVFVTASGMAAMTTILACLLKDETCTGPILIGKSSYFENIQLVQLYFPGRIIFVDEMDTAGILEAIAVHTPSALFLDTICNAITLAAPDCSALFPQIAKIVTAPLTIVLDTTGAGTSYQPLQDMPFWGKFLRLVAFESLLKYHQFGMDRVSGGVVWRSILSPVALFTHRKSLGTNLVDSSVLALPTPNRKRLDMRLHRHHRNATLIAVGLDQLNTEASQTALQQVVYPGLPSHPAYAWMKLRLFHGSAIVLVLKEQYRNTATYKKFLQIAVDEARKLGVDLVGGSSFGFSITRIYLTALHATGTAEPFLRVSVGTETVMEIEKITKAITRALEKLA